MHYIYSQKTLGSNMGVPNLFCAPGAIQHQSTLVSLRALRKSLILMLVLEIKSFRSLTKIHDHR